MRLLKKINDTFRITCFSLLPLVVLCVCFELGVRAFYQETNSPLFRQFVNPEWRSSRVCVADKDLFWLFRPDTTINGINQKEGSYRIDINRAGFRGPNWDDPAGQGAVRMMFAGDSCVFGWDAPDGKSYPDRLLHYFSEDHPNKRFHSFRTAVPGFSSYQVKVATEKYLPLYKPNFLVVWCGTNDALPLVGYPDSEMADVPFFSPISVRLREEVHAVRWLQDRVIGVRPSGETTQILPPDDVGPPRVTLEEFKTNFDSVLEMCRECDTKLAVVTRQDLRPDPPVKAYNKVLREWAKSQSVPVAEVAGAFASAEDPRSLYAKPDLDYVHPNPDGYDLVARIVYNAVKEAGWPE